MLPGQVGLNDTFRNSLILVTLNVLQLIEIHRIEKTNLLLPWFSLKKSLLVFKDGFGKQLWDVNTTDFLTLLDSSFLRNGVCDNNRIQVGRVLDSFQGLPTEDPVCCQGINWKLEKNISESYLISFLVVHT